MGMKIGARLIGLFIACILGFVSHHLYTLAMRVLNSPLATQTFVTVLLALGTTVLAIVIVILIILIVFAVFTD